MAQSRKIIAWGVGLGLLLGAAGTTRSQDQEKAPNVSIEADHEPLLNVIKRICAAQGLNFVANDAALEKAGKVSLSLHDVPLETALDVICEAYGLEARVRSRILVVKPREHEALRAPAVEPRRTPRFMPEEPRESVPSEERPKATVRAPEPEAAPVTTVVYHTTSGATTGGGRMTAGMVVEVSATSVKVKEASGEPREFAVGQGDDDAARASKLTQALHRLKVGDRVALEYRVVEGHAFITNLVGGGNPIQKP